ncbi:hypothetical protein AHAS_Ahas04G0223400 [Arachis hypogaea]
MTYSSTMRISAATHSTATLFYFFFELVFVARLLPNNFTLPCVIKAYTGLTEVELGKALHALALKLGLCSDSFVKNALIARYDKCGFVESAFKVFVEWCSDDEDSVPDVATMVTMVPVVATTGEVNLGMLFYSLALKLNFEIGTFTRELEEDLERERERKRER